MTYHFLRNASRRPAGDRRDTGAVAIVVMMMALVFVPIAVAHIAAAYQGSLADFGSGQIAGFVHMLMPTTASN